MYWYTISISITITWTVLLVTHNINGRNMLLLWSRVTPFNYRLLHAQSLQVWVTSQSLRRRPKIQFNALFLTVADSVSTHGFGVFIVVPTQNAKFPRKMYKFWWVHRSAFDIEKTFPENIFRKIFFLFVRKTFSDKTTLNPCFLLTGKKISAQRYS